MPPAGYDEQVVMKVWNPPAGVSSYIAAFLQEVQAVSIWDHDSLDVFIRDFISRNNIKMGQLMNPLRLLLVGNNQGPGIIDFATILGKEEFLKRIQTGIAKLRP